jgi:dihydrofolate reductase
MNTSLDGYVEGPDGTFAWSHPDEEVHRFHNGIAGEMDAFLYGRRMYETMAGWQDIDETASVPDYIVEFARIWRSRPKYVFSSTLASVGVGHELVRGDLADAVRRIAASTTGDLGVGGPGVAASLAKLDLIDEYGMVKYPVIVGGGKSYFPPGLAVPLSLRETRTFSCGAVYLRYSRA